MAKRIKIESEYVWERQEGESREAYEAFSLYRDMGADGGKRSLQAVSNELSKSLTLMKRWSASYNWIERARAYDFHVEDLALRKATQSLAKARERQMAVGGKLQQMGFAALKETTITDPAVALKMIIEGAKLEYKQLEAETAAHTPTSQETTDSEALKRLDEVLKEIKSAF